MSLGAQLIGELGRRQELGMYFNYAGYRRLRGIDDAWELADFLREQGFADAPTASTPAQLADWLRKTAEAKQDRRFQACQAIDCFGEVIALCLELLY